MLKKFILFWPCDRLGNGYNPQRLIEQTKMGAAGYDPEEPDMRGILLAKGPGREFIYEAYC